MDQVANNLANVNTPGFKAVRTDLVDVRWPADDRPIGGGVRMAGTTRDLRQGALLRTDNPLDLTIDGPGFFRVRLPDGQWAYTRDGAFKRDADGRLVTADGYYLDTDAQFQPEDSTVYVTTDGGVWAETPGGQPVQRGTIPLYRFPNSEGLQAIGDNLFVETPASGAAQAGAPGEGFGNLMSGSLEGSNVEISQEMVQMLIAQRSYSLALRVLETVDQMQQQANELGG
jgi:flagellar basal-body rod protein FlgG